MSKILVVEDTPEIATTIEDWLTHEKFTVEVVYDGLEASERLKLYKYDAVVLDWELPKISGVQVCQQFRKQGGITPILMLTGKSTMSDKEAGFDAGADDYLTKPFDVRELSMRLRAIMRRGTAVADNVLAAGPLSLDTKAHTCLVNGQAVNFLPKEFAILELLLRHPGEVFSGEALLDRIWKSESDATSQKSSYIYVFIEKETDR